MLRGLLSVFASDDGGRILVRVAVTAGVVGALSVGVAHFISNRVEAEREALATLIRTGRPPAPSRAAEPKDLDTITTGSIRKRAEQTRIDPCTVEAKR